MEQRSKVLIVEDDEIFDRVCSRLWAHWGS